MTHCQINTEYPEPREGEKVIRFALDPFQEKQESDDLLLELLPGRTVRLSKTDAFNNPRYNGKVSTKVVENTSNKYYCAKMEDQFLTTRMALPYPDDGQAVEMFVPIAHPSIISYSSASPVIVYLPKDAELRYSVWSASDVCRATAE